MSLKNSCIYSFAQAFMCAHKDCVTMHKLTLVEPAVVGQPIQ